VVGDFTLRPISSTAFNMGVEIRRTEVESVIDARYVCESCDVALDAAVQSYGFSSLPSALGDEEDGVNGAQFDAIERAEDTLRFVPCPNCGHRQSGRGEVIFKTVLVYVGATVAAGVGMGIVSQAKDMGEGYTIWGSLGVAGVMAIISIVTLLTWRRHPWVDAAKRTTWSGPPVERDPSARRPSEQRGEELTEERAMRKKLLYAALFSLAVGIVFAAVQYWAQRGGH
jgi:hypothetical protein